MVLQVYVSEQRRRVLKVCDFDFGEGNDEDNDYQGSEALEKKVTTMERKGQHDHAAFIRLLQVSLTVTLTVALMVTVTVMCWHPVSCLLHGAARGVLIRLSGMRRLEMSAGVLVLRAGGPELQLGVSVQGRVAQP